METVHDGIRGCAFIVADVSGGNGNVMYEVAFSQPLGKTTLFIARDAPSEVPFAFRVFSCIHYDPQKLDSLISKLRERIKIWQRDGNNSFRL